MGHIIKDRTMVVRDGLDGRKIGLWVFCWLLLGEKGIIVMYRYEIKKRNKEEKSTSHDC